MVVDDFRVKLGGSGPVAGNRSRASNNKHATATRSSHLREGGQGRIAEGRSTAKAKVVDAAATGPSFEDKTIVGERTVAQSVEQRQEIDGRGFESRSCSLNLTRENAMRSVYAATWTRGWPTEPGDYWYSGSFNNRIDDDGLHFVSVYRHAGDMVIMAGSMVAYCGAIEMFRSTCEGQWTPAIVPALPS